MDDDRRKRDELGSAPTTPGPAPDPAAQQFAAGSTLDMPADEITPRDPMRIGRFIVKARLGAGGMGVVYAGEDADLGRRVAIKLVRGDAEQPAFRDRLVREAQAMARLEHPNVVRVYEVGQAEGRTFVAMEFVDGETLSKWLAQRRPWREVVAMFEQAGEGLSAVHRAGLVHRDFKPDNVLVDRQGRARVADFGLARIEQGVQPLTGTGVGMGTPGYMAPEQAYGAAEVDARADQYSFCVALREALGGRPVDETRWREAPEPVRAAISRGLSYDPDERFASIDELLAQLRAPPPLEPKPREPRWPLALLAVAILGTAAAVVAYVGSHRGVRDGEDAVARRQASGLRPQAADAAAPVVVAAAPDAAVQSVAVIDVAPIDAGVVVKRARDAGVHVVAVDAAEPSESDKLAQIIVAGPHTKGWPVAKPGAPGHMDIVRKAIANIGYDGVDVGNLDAKALEAERAGAMGDDKEIAKIKIGILERHRGDCAAAHEHLKTVLRPYDNDLAGTWYARAWLNEALCELAEGDGANAYKNAARAWQKADQSEVSLVMGFAAYEGINTDNSKKDLALAHLLQAQRSTVPRVQAALKIWLDGLGLALN